MVKSCFCLVKNLEQDKNILVWLKYFPWWHFEFQYFLSKKQNLLFTILRIKNKTHLGNFNEDNLALILLFELKWPRGDYQDL